MKKLDKSGAPGDQTQFRYPPPRRTEPLVAEDSSRAHALLRSPRTAYAAAEQLGRLERIHTVQDGVPARLLAALADDMGIARDLLLRWLGLSRATANRKIRDDRLLNQDESERTLGIARLIGSVERVVAESGAPAGFDAPLWTAQWLQAPSPALGGHAPAEFMSTADGRALAASLIAQMQSGAYA